jgi:hypothetical protein
LLIERAQAPAAVLYVGPMDIEAPDFGKRIADNFMSVFDNGELDHSMLREAALEGVLPTGTYPPHGELPFALTKALAPRSQNSMASKVAAAR